MKYLVVSDIHGSLSGAEALEESFQYHNADAILSLGDILYHGPRNDLPEDYTPKKVIEIIKKYTEEIITVRGNCDGEVDEMVLGFPILSTTNYFFLGKHKVCMSHGHVFGPDHLPPLAKDDIFLSGHTHIPTAYQNENDIYLLNPGSISLPKENHPRSYAVLDETSFTIYKLDHTEYMHIDF